MITWTVKHLRLAVEAAEIALWSWNVDTDKIFLDERAHKLWGIPQNIDITFEDLSAQIYPADRDRVRAGFAATRAIVGPYDINFRIMLGSEIRWISARGQGDDANIRNGVMFGVFLDVTGRKQAEEANELLAGEMSHRVRNLLTIATSLTAITWHAAETKDQMAHDLTQRLAALGRAHDLVRPIPGQLAEVALFGDLLTVLLAPYDGAGTCSGRIRVSVPRLGVSEGAATTLALVIHELATNSVKYGSLSVKTGTLDVSCESLGDELVVVWMERGGPPVVPPADSKGYGSRLVTRSMSRLGGSLAYNWDKAGVVVTLRMTNAALAA